MDTLVVSDAQGLLPKNLEKILGVVRAAGSSAVAGLGSEGLRGGGQRIDRLSRWVFPIAFVAIFGFAFLI